MLFDTTTGLQRWNQHCFRSPWGSTKSFVGCGAAFSQDTVTLAVGGSSNSNVKLFDVATGELRTEMNLWQDYQVLAATCSHERGSDDSFIFTMVAKQGTSSVFREVNIYSFSTNGTCIKRSELDLYGYGYGYGPFLGEFKSAFSRDASIMVLHVERCNKIALYDVATGKLRLKKRPPGRGVG